MLFNIYRLLNSIFTQLTAYALFALLNALYAQKIISVKCTSLITSGKRFIAVDSRVLKRRQWDSKYKYTSTSELSPLAHLTVQLLIKRSSGDSDNKNKKSTLKISLEA